MSSSYLISSCMNQERFKHSGAFGVRCVGVIAFRMKGESGGSGADACALLGFGELPVTVVASSLGLLGVGNHPRILLVLPGLAMDLCGGRGTMGDNALLVNAVAL